MRQEYKPRIVVMNEQSFQESKVVERQEAVF